MLSIELAESQEQLLFDRKYRQLVEKIARKYTQNYSISWEDAAQTAHFKILQGLRTGKFIQKGQKGTEEFYPWAAIVARNAVIDFVRGEKKHNRQSLDRKISGTDVSLLDTIADQFDLWDAVERANLIIKVREIIENLALSYPKREYIKLWKGLVQGQSQTQLASELGITQGQVSRRRKELLHQVAEELGLFKPEFIKQEQQNVRKSQVSRKRSQSQW